MSALSKKEIRDMLWRRGELTFKMHSVQKEMYEVYKNSEPRSTLVWLLSRQTGKTYCLVLIALMEAIQHPNSIIKILTGTKIHIQSVVEPAFREILEDCPDDIRPEYIKSSYVYEFPNGSKIQMAGTDAGNAERLRGQKSRCILVDEAAFCDNLDYNVMSILLPTTTHTGGKIVLASTPPEEPDHDFINFIEQAEQEGKLTKKTLFENPLLPDEEKQNIVKRFPGGINNPQFRREYLCIASESKVTIKTPTGEIKQMTIKELKDELRKNI